MHGAITLLQWPHPTSPLTARVRADGGRVFLAVDGHDEVMVYVVRLDIPHGGFRPHFLCPRCNNRAWNLYALSGQLACRRCSNLDYACRHELRWCSALHQVRETRPGINIFDLHHRGALVHGAITLLQWPHPTSPLTARVRADGGRVFLAVDGHDEVMVYVVRLDIPHGGFRPHFLCPRCNNRAWNLYALSGQLACRRCSNLDYACRHELRWCSALHQVRRLRVRLGAEPIPFAPLPARPRRYPQYRLYDRLVRRLKAAEAIVADRFNHTMSAIARIHCG